jgi:hypothetical protein
MDVQINQAGANNFPPGIETFDFLWCFGRRVFAEGGNFSVNDEQIRNRVEFVGGVNDAPAGEEQRIHPARIASAD